MLLESVAYRTWEEVSGMWRRLGLIVLAAWAMAACESTPERVFTYGARGVEIEAERFVADIYGQPADPLPYGNADIYFATDGIKARWPSLRPLLEDGTLGQTDDGDVALRSVGGRGEEELRKLRSLVKAENRDRFFLYRGVTSAVGWHGEESVRMIDYTEDAFAKEWSRQAPKGWWFRDDRGNWRQTP